MPVYIRQIRARVIAGPDHPVDRVHPLIRRLSRRIETVLALEQRIRMHKGLVVKIRGFVVNRRTRQHLRSGSRIEPGHGPAHPGPVIRQVVFLVAGCTCFVACILFFGRPL